ncbi:hypothetical protein THRCLA_22373 [Thraustotheca clavata]|uniref:Uncharacterized protein n=1 Tax=Thraustotheca clavata TaxID=74557 RepID=A0A1V9Z3S3_9STRA|nr:hypothetical protein THRCLA_22373 [Thraustotheca clavata]
MTDRTMEYGASFAMLAMEGEDNYMEPLMIYEHAEAHDLCSDSEDALYAAALIAAFSTPQVKIAPEPMYSFL